MSLKSRLSKAFKSNFLLASGLAPAVHQQEKIAGQKGGAAIDAETARRQGIDTGINDRNAALTGQEAADAEFRSGLISAQRGGLASTILNIGGAAGDPNKLRASQAVGTDASGLETGLAPVLEGKPAFGALPVRKKSAFLRTFGTQ